MSRRRWVVPALWGLAGILGTYVRVAGVGEQVLHGDEGHALRSIPLGYRAVLTSFDGLGSHVGFPLLQRAALDLLGWSAAVYRLPAVLAGVLGLWLVFPLGRALVGPGPACLATWVVALNALHVYHSRSARPYSTVFLLGLLLLAALHAAVRGKRRAWLAVAVLAGLLPWFHLSAAGPVAALGLASLVLTRRSGAGARDAVVAFATAALLCGLLYLPAARDLARYLAELAGGPGDPASHLPGAVAILGGGPIGAAWLAAGGVVGAAWIARRAPAAGVLIAASALAPFAVLAATSPAGWEQAVARYLVMALAPLALASAWALLRCARGRAGTAAAVGLAALALLPAAPRLLDRGWLHGTFVGPADVLAPDPALDAHFPDAPALYAELARSARELTVAEFPCTPESSLVLRRYARQHGQRVLVAAERDVPLFAAHPYVRIDDAQSLRARSDWLVVHLDLAAELDRYLAFLGRENLRRHRPVLRLDTRWLLAALGEPTYRDERVWAWAFDRRPE